MNEADLYSLQKRKYKNQNVEENIKTMKKVKKEKRKIYKMKSKLLYLMINQEMEKIFQE